MNGGSQLSRVPLINNGPPVHAFPPGSDQMVGSSGSINNSSNMIKNNSSGLNLYVYGSNNNSRDKMNRRSSK